MSQKKVDAYKESKKTRKEDVKKEKRAKKVGAIIGWIVLVAVIAALAIGLAITFRNVESTASTGDGYTVTNQVISDLADMEGKNETEAPSESEESGEETTAAAGE